MPFDQVLTKYGQHALRIGQASNLYAEKYKGIWLSLTVLTRALAGNYVNFGVFDLYGDPALKVRQAFHAGCFKDTSHHFPLLL